jgi:hypothetical protein
MSTPGARVNVTTAAKELAGGDRDGATALLRNAGAASIDLGDSNP